MKATESDTNTYIIIIIVPLSWTHYISPSVLLPYSIQAVENISSLLKCWDLKVTLKAVAYQVRTLFHSEILGLIFPIMQVPLQQGIVDYGVHVMKHIPTVTQMQVCSHTVIYL